MKLSELMAQYADIEATGASTGDDMVLAVDIAPTKDSDVGDYIVVQAGLKSQNSSLNPETKTSSYIRQGKSSIKTGNQRTINWEADVILGDQFLDWVLSHRIKYATGQDAVFPYVWFNMRSKKGEKGVGTIVVNEDANATPEEPLGASGSIEKYAAQPQEFTWSTTGTVYQVNLNAMGGEIASGHDVTSYTSGTGATLPDSTYVTKNNYTFGGWYTDSACTGTAVTAISADAAGDKTFYAKWTASE